MPERPARRPPDPRFPRVIAMALCAALLGVVAPRSGAQAPAAQPQTSPTSQPAPQSTAAQTPGTRASTALLSTDPTLAKALGLQSTGDSRAAADAYRSWLDAHSRPADARVAALYVEALLSFAEVETDARLVQYFLSTAPAASLGAEGRWRIGLALAELLDMLGDVAEAQSRYEEAARSDPTPSGPSSIRSLLRSAALLYEQGEWDRAEAQAREAGRGAAAFQDEELETSSRYLLGRIHAAAGKSEAAEEEWRDIVERHAHAPSAPAACLGLWLLYLHLDRAADAASVLELLAERYPESPELGLARAARAEEGPGVLVVSRPSAVLEDYASALAARGNLPAQPTPSPVATPAAATSVAQPTPAASPGPTPAPQAKGTIIVLAGSYTRRENAEEQMREVQSAGFDSHIVDATVSGRRYYRVVVGEPMAYDTALELMQKMKDRNLESVPILAEASD